MTTRRKKAPDPAPAPAAEPPAVSAASLAEFIGIDGDPHRLEQAIALASAAAAAELEVPALPAELSHPLAQAVKLLASKLLITDQLEHPPAAADLPLVVRYYLKVARAQG
jgi:hypothetical protein